MNFSNEIRICWPIGRILNNPDLVIPISNRIGISNWEIIYEAFYMLLETEIIESVEMMEEDEGSVPETAEDLVAIFDWISEEVCFSYFPEENIVRVSGDSGIMIQLEEGGFGPKRVEKGSPHSGIRNSDEFQISSTLYQGFIEAIEKTAPELKGDIVLCTPPVPSNNYLRDEVTDNFVGQFHLISDPDKKYDFSISVNTDNKESVATVVESQGE